jgi:hypothetical protein
VDVPEHRGAVVRDRRRRAHDSRGRSLGKIAVDICLCAQSLRAFSIPVRLHIDRAKLNLPMNLCLRSPPP